MNGFEWRYIAAGLGWGVAVGILSGLLVGWGVVLVEASFASERSAGDLLGGLFWVGVGGAYFGGLGGSVGGTIVGLGLSVLVGRQKREQVAAWTAAIVCLLATPVLTWVALSTMGFELDTWIRREQVDPWTWVTLGIPTVLSVVAMSWTARRLARRNAVLRPAVTHAAASAAADA